MFKQGFRKIAALLFLTSFLAAGCSLLPGRGNDQEPQELPLEEAPGQVIAPAVERRDISVPKIDTENSEVGPCFGVRSGDDCGSRGSYGRREA